MKSDELDKILDGALPSYSREEPRPGLDSRVFDRIREARERRRFGWSRWARAIPAVACVLLAITFWSTRDSIPKPSKPAPIISNTAPLPPIARGAVQTKVIRRRLK